MRAASRLLPALLLALGATLLPAAAGAISVSVGVSVGVSPDASEGLRLAYIDPGSGSFLVQALVATLAGIAVALRTYWHKVRELLGHDARADDDDPNE